MSMTLDATLRLIDDLRQRGEDFCVATVVRTAAATSAKAGAKAVVTADGTLHGFVGGGCVQGAVRKAALQVLETGEPRLIRVKPKEEIDAATDRDGVELHGSGCPSGGTVEFFLEPTRRRMRLIILGSAPVAAALARLGQAIGVETVSVEPAESVDLADLDPGARDAVVVATQGRRDRQALEAALRSNAGYVGMIGSRKKIGVLLDRLGDGIPDPRKQALRGPAGLDIGAIEPEEIALSVLAEIIQTRRSAR
ncbi:MAG: XdhC/CoxI family protein [Alphaproteobacteria bacterium]